MVLVWRWWRFTWRRERWEMEVLGPMVSDAVVYKRILGNLWWMIGPA